MSLTRRIFLGYFFFFLITLIPCFVPRNYTFETQTIYKPTHSPKPPKPTPIYVQAHIPDDVIEEVDSLRKDAEVQISQFANDEQQISELNRQLRYIQRENDNIAQSIESAKHSPSEVDENEVVDAVGSRIIRDEYEALLVSIVSNTEKRGATKLERLFRMDPNNRAHDEIPKENGVSCIKGTIATFSFWLQFPAVVESITISYNSTVSSMADMFKVKGYLDNEIVYESPTMYELVTKVKLDNPTRIKTIKIIASNDPGNEKVCFGNVTVVSPANLK